MAEKMAMVYSNCPIQFAIELPASITVYIQQASRPTYWFGDLTATDASVWSVIKSGCLSREWAKSLPNGFGNLLRFPRAKLIRSPT